MKKKLYTQTEYRLSIMRQEEEDRFFGRGWAEPEISKAKHWKEYVGFNLTDQEVIEILGLIARMRGLDYRQ